MRSGPWKLAIVRQNENTGKPNPDKAAAAEFKPTLYNLDDDIGEKNDVAAEHPEVVERLQKLIAAMDADLGAKQKGPGVRAPGRVTDPTGLYLTDSNPKPQE